MDEEKPILTGYLIVQSGKSLNRISKKKIPRYCLLFKSSRHGIERLEIYESAEDKNPKIITLENCVKITQEAAPANLIQIVKKTGTLTLNTVSEADLKDWVTALQSVAFRDKSEVIQTAIEEDNDLYCSSFGDGLFMVTLIPSDASKRCNMESKVYMLQLTATELQLRAVDDGNMVIAKWPYRFIRKYGYRDGKFTFEAGRKCTTGEGVFILDHSNPLEVFRCMSAKMKSMKKLIHGDTTNMNVECGEQQLSIAASMEAGSRSPLPASPNQQGVDFETASSYRGASSTECSINSSINSCSNNNLHLPASIKHIPNKPPRRIAHVPLDKLQNNTSNSYSSSSSSTNLESTKGTTCQLPNTIDRYRIFQNYEPVTITSSSDPNKTIGSTVILKPISPVVLPRNNAQPERDYESIENITDAWKTLGVSDVRHTERIIAATPSGDKEQGINLEKHPFPPQRDNKTPNNEVMPMPSVKKPQIIDIDIGEGNYGNINVSGNDETTYDHLDFLSANNTASGGYKTILNLSMEKRSSTPATNDYEYIASPDNKKCTYSVLRKTTEAPKAKTTNHNAATPTQNDRTALLVDLPIPIPHSARANVNNSSLDHRSYNGLNYTIVSKPKRV